jgi:hypothetical protein
MSYNIVIVDEDFEIEKQFKSMVDAIRFAEIKGFNFDKPSVNKAFILSDKNDISVCTLSKGDIERQKNLSIIYFDEEVYLPNKAKQKFFYIIVKGRHLFFDENNVVHTMFSRIRKNILQHIESYDIKEMTPEDAINQMHVDVGIKKDWRKYAKGSN